MLYEKDSVIEPIPTDEDINKREQSWRLKLPIDYIDFIKKYNACIPVEKSFDCNNHSYAIVRFLGILSNWSDSELGWYDISVVASGIEERLTDNEDLVGLELLPIAELFAGDYLCLNFKSNKEVPTVCVWNHEESDEFMPVIYEVADSFKEFIDMLG